MSSSSNQKLAHAALLPSSGMGHLTPFIRLAASLALHNVQLTFITPTPTVSLTESQALSTLFAAFPQIKQKQFRLPQQNHSSSEDPFFVHFQLIKNSAHLLLPQLLSSLNPPLSVLITDMTLASTVIPIAEAMNLPNYVLFTSSAKMLTLFLSYHSLAMEDLDEMDSNGMIKIDQGSEWMMPKSWIPPPLLDKGDNIFKKNFTEEGRRVAESSSGVLVNTFESFEHDSIGKLNDIGQVLREKQHLRRPSVICIGPFPPCDFQKRRNNSSSSEELSWLDDQPAGSVVYVSFGSRTALSREQLRELGEGLVKCGSRFLWVVKDKKVDREDDGGLEQVLEHEQMERVKENGLVAKKWVNQDDILSHRAVGGFLSHCGWNSVMEAAWHGVRILGWPLGGDQRINAAVVERMGLGMWEKSWGWSDDQKIVNGSEIAEKIDEMMKNQSLRDQAMRIREEGRKAVEVGGSSYKGLTELIDTWKKF